MPLILDDQRRRGPDHSSVLHLRRDALQISFAHNRLAILDLNSASNQPFVDEATGTAMVFNGEIYNYIELRRELEALGESFRTSSDTEVLLKAYVRWGVDAFARLNGMFAFAVWDPRTHELVLARDRFGVKPLYYLNRGGKFAFASNTSAIARFFDLPIRFDYVSHGLTYNLYEDNAGASPFEGLRSVPPGHYVVLNGDLKVKPFYDLHARVDAEVDRIRGLSDEAILSRLEETLLSAVELRLRSDVPVTVSMSGGLDSSLLAALVKEIRGGTPDVFTFATYGDKHSEAVLAGMSAARLGLRLNLAEIRPENFVEQFEKTLAAQGAPFAHPSVIAQNRVFEIMHAHGYKVSIGGQGADEVFMGYRKFQVFNLVELAHQRQWLNFARAAAGLSLMLASEAHDPRVLLRNLARYWRHRRPPVPALIDSAGGDMNIGFDGYPTLRDRQMADMSFASLSTLLRYEDRNSMGHSVESRMPFLDYRVVELGLAMPPHLKIQRGYGKWILRRLGEKRLPPLIVQARSKLAFALSTKAWLNGGLGAHLYASVKPKLARFEGVMTPHTLGLLREEKTYYDPINFPLAVSAHWLAARL